MPKSSCFRRETTPRQLRGITAFFVQEGNATTGREPLDGQAGSTTGDGEGRIERHIDTGHRRGLDRFAAVSYTHLDVYKRQAYGYI